jgi:hypothetical protein
LRLVDFVERGVRVQVRVLGALQHGKDIPAREDVQAMLGIQHRVRLAYEAGWAWACVDG